MNIINLFLIILILYLIYKVAVHGEKFQATQDTQDTQDTIDLSDVDIINSKNIFMNIDESRLEEINKIPELDLSKNNLIIDNRYGNKVSISDKLCVGNYCINSEKLKTLTGEIDGPQFYKHNTQTKTDTPKYYNHDCGIGVDNSNSFKCDIDKEIDYPDKLCFNYLNGNGTKQEPTCIESDHFDVLKGVKGLKLKHTYSNRKVSNATTVESDPKYMTPYYMDFKQSGNGIEGTKDQLFFKNNDECLGKELLKDNNKADLTDKNPRELIMFTQDPKYSGCFNQTTPRDYGRKTTDTVLRFGNGTLAQLKTEINRLWAAATAIIVAATAAATALLVASFGLAAPAYIYALTQIPSYTKLIKVDIPNIEIIMANIKTEYDLNWWNGSNSGGKKYPYYFDKTHELNCEDVDCDTAKKFMCPRKCNDKIKQSKECGGTCLDNPVLAYGEDNKHGYYTLNNFIPEDAEEIITKIKKEHPKNIDPLNIHKTIDPDYNGYYLSNENNNTKYKIKENAISRVSKFLGANLNTHRITGDAPRCANIDDLSNTSYYCSGKNGGESDKEYLCNPVKYKIDNIIKCVNDKVADAADEADTVGKVYTKLSEITADLTLNDYYIECIGGEPVQGGGKDWPCIDDNECDSGLCDRTGSIVSVSRIIPCDNTNEKQKCSCSAPTSSLSTVSQTTISQDTIQPQGSKNSQIEPEKPTENYVMTPAKDADGNDIKANTYFHGHSHIH